MKISNTIVVNSIAETNSWQKTNTIYTYDLAKNELKECTKLGNNRKHIVSSIFGNQLVTQSLCENFWKNYINFIIYDIDKHEIIKSIKINSQYLSYSAHVFGNKIYMPLDNGDIDIFS